MKGLRFDLQMPFKRKRKRFPSTRKRVNQTKMLATSSKSKSRPIPIKTSNLTNNLEVATGTSNMIGNKAAAAGNPYPSPVSPSALSFSPAKFLSSYQLPLVFTSHYRLLEELGYGGFGFVYSVVRLADGARFACKFIFKSKVSRTSWTIDRELGQCPIEVAVLKNVLFIPFALSATPLTTLSITFILRSVMKTLSSLSTILTTLCFATALQKCMVPNGLTIPS